ncbi:MAG TPA: ATP-binding protein [Gaiellaceae bacterium]|nr:ATP-binding protein [Gaiellaceae bacterium]
MPEAEDSSRNGEARAAGSDAHALIDAAVQMNRADTLDEALSILVGVGRTLLRADRVSVSVWDEALTRGTIVAASGLREAGVGLVIEPGENPLYQAAATRLPVLGELDSSRWNESRTGGPVDELKDLKSFVAVPFLAEENPTLTFQSGWLTIQSTEDLERAVATLRLLGSLTRIAYRAHDLRAAVDHQARLEAVLDAVGEAVVVQAGTTITASAAARRVLAADGQLPTPVSARFGGPEGVALSPAEFLGAAARPSDAPRTFKVRIVDHGGEQHVVTGSIAPIAFADNDAGTVAVFHDITAEHKREFLTAQFLKGLFDELPTAIGVVDPETREILSVNPAFLHMVGYEEEEVVGSLPPHPWWASHEELEHGPRQEAIIRHRDGSLIPIRIVRFVVPDASGAAVADVALVTDLSEQRLFERQLLQSGKLATIGELAAGVAHEINNPLFAILGLVEFLLKDAEVGTKGHDRLVLIQRTGIEIKEIVRALLDFAREPSDERALISVEDAAHETVELFRRTSAAKASDLLEDYCGQDTVVDGSGNQLKQIFLNLLTNATHAVGGAGGEVALAVRREGDWVVATVSDTGPGIPEDVLPRIFDPFFTTKRGTGGSGLGLSVSLGIAQAHGGTLLAENRDEGGARFVLRLPADPGRS